MKMEQMDGTWGGLFIRLNTEFFERFKTCMGGLEDERKSPPRVISATVLVNLECENSVTSYKTLTIDTKNDGASLPGGPERTQLAHEFVGILAIIRMLTSSLETVGKNMGLSDEEIKRRAADGLGMLFGDERYNFRTGGDA